jgi:hypothetical protein
VLPLCSAVKSTSLYSLAGNSASASLLPEKVENIRASSEAAAETTLDTHSKLGVSKFTRFDVHSASWSALAIVSGVGKAPLLTLQPLPLLGNHCHQRYRNSLIGKV